MVGEVKVNQKSKKIVRNEGTRVVVERSIDFKSGVFLYLKGFLMGTCDIIPGISGGTIAFITGIYLRLISAIKGLNPKSLFDFVKDMFSFDFKKINLAFKKLDLYFLIVLFFGIFSAIFAVSAVVKFLLENYYVYTLSFFVGLILASSGIIFKEIKVHTKLDVFYAFLGFLVGFSMIFLAPNSISNPNLLYVVLGGFIGVSALFLPGISGSFILLVMGIYEFVIDALHNITEQYLYLIGFGIGAVMGAFLISRVIVFLYAWNRVRTLYILLGIVLGSLFVPIRNVADTINTGGVVSYGFMFLVFFLGMILVVMINMFSSEE